MTGSGALGISLILFLLGVAMVITLFTLIVILLIEIIKFFKRKNSESEKNS